VVALGELAAEGLQVVLEAAQEEDSNSLVSVFLNTVKSTAKNNSPLVVGGLEASIPIQEEALAES
jgi:hypothetical protein